MSVLNLSREGRAEAYTFIFRHQIIKEGTDLSKICLWIKIFALMNSRCHILIKTIQAQKREIVHKQFMAELFLFSVNGQNDDFISHKIMFAVI